VDPGTKLSDQDYRTVGMDGFSALAIGSNGRSYGVVANSAAPRPLGTLVTVEAYCGPRWPRNVLTLEKRKKTMNRRNIARYRRTLEATRAQLMACDHNPGSSPLERTADSTEESGIGSERDLALATLWRRAVLLRHVENALERIAVGAYGACLECQEPISEKRLLALPWTALCLSCQEAARITGTNHGRRQLVQGRRMPA
jgi:DnaK suppressor protein